MFFYPVQTPLPDYGLPPIVHEETVDRWSRAASGFVPGGFVPVSAILVGEANYRLRQPVRGHFLRVDGIACEFWVDGFSPCFVGRGVKTREAYLDWRDQVHETFQELYGKRPFEMTSEERERWHVLEHMIDVVSYRNETPIVVRQIGQVTQARPLPRQITWVDGRKDGVHLDLMPPEFAGYKPGQPFEADVERDPLTWKLRKVRHVQRISTIHPLSATELQKYWKSMPGTNTLPASDRDWTES